MNDNNIDYSDASNYRIEINKNEKKIQDNIFIASIIENLSIILPVLLKELLTPKRKNSKDFIRNYFISLFGGLIATEGCMGICFILINKIYKHWPYFNEKDTPKFTLNEYIKKWLNANFKVHLIASLIETCIIYFITKDEKEFIKKVNTPFYKNFSIINFLKKLIINRILIDIFFYISHYILHTEYFYEKFHKKHHEHQKAVSIYTNLQFTATDLYFEAVFPLVVSLGIQESLGSEFGSFEGTLIASYTQYYEIMSHAGKSLPVQTMVPPLSFIYNPLFKLIFGNDKFTDRDGTLFHSKHHQYKSCNYGISPWLDNLIGTTRYDTKQGTRKKSLSNVDIKLNNKIE